MYRDLHYLILLANDYNKAKCLIIFLLQFSVISNTNQSFDLTLRVLYSHHLICNNYRFSVTKE